MDLNAEYSTELRWFILEGIYFLLHHNYFFLFNEKWYVQKQEASMGASFSSTYANLYMGWWEEQHVYNTCKPHRDSITAYFQYIEDLFFIVKCGLPTTVVPNS